MSMACRSLLERRSWLGGFVRMLTQLSCLLVTLSEADPTKLQAIKGDR
jgi:hypothetical protein